jgi:hypothetical protein
VPRPDLLADLRRDVADVDQARVEQVRPVEAGGGDLGPDLVSAIVVSAVSMLPTLTVS